jgi:membrane protease YdiL (CAAX protease family)
MDGVLKKAKTSRVGLIGEKMTTQTASPNILGKDTLQTNRLQRPGLFILFLACGLAILMFGSYYFDIFPTNRNLAYDLVLCALFLAASLWFRFSKRMNRYWQVTFAFFIASVAYPFSALLDGGTNAVLRWLHSTTASSQGIAIAKMCEMVLKTSPILVLVKLSRADFGSIFLKRGNWKLGLSVGSLVWFNFTASAFLFFATRYTSIDKLGAALLWGLVFSFANSFMEELWLRGIFLNHFKTFIGTGGSILLTSLVFALVHAGATYLTPVAIPFIVAYAFTMGLACGYLILKTDSLWGAVLIHAAADLFLFIAMLAGA